MTSILTISTIVFLVIAVVQSVRLHQSKKDNLSLQYDYNALYDAYENELDNSTYWYETVKEIGEQNGIYNL